MTAQWDHRPQIKTPQDILPLVDDMRSFEQEHVRILILNAKNRLLRAHEQYVGSLTGCTIRVGELFREAVRDNAAAIVLVHNHPSGEPTPSPNDVALTRDLIAAGKLLDVAVLDHVVIGTRGHFSLRELGLGFSPHGSAD